MSARSSVIFSIAFRPFFILCAGFAVLAVASWSLALHGLLVPSSFSVMWHAHEMLFGFAGAAVAGFLLTAVATWTGRPPVAGVTLAVLVAAWLAGRAAMALTAALPAIAVAVVDMSFPLLLAAIAVREILAGGSRRNYGVAVVLVVFAVLNAVFHLGEAGVWPASGLVAVYLTAHGLLVLITVIAGRIVPSFTGNWLRQRGATQLPISRQWLEIAIVPLVVAAGLADSTAMPPAVVAVFSIAAAVLHALRLSGWRGSGTTAEPLVTILHIAYAWLPVGYLLLGLSALGLPVPRSAALHALTMGGIGLMILAVITRVALGHTGRPLTAAPLTVVAYIALNIAVLLRVLSPLAPEAYLTLLDNAALAWIIAFGLFLWTYWPILSGPNRRSP